ncbi:hypothetical protein OV207_11720 [Corallococcus sp. BB11-1]|uniref:hypothetical protein n=1 Tax=Corallococcus sp. BB11-1 TaxID=2996783 RepID=UPI00226E5354|nr:hypothetical protein [Corallococcus sp. BB11-1]MCY1032129.1 hypothetical protein [Corallococcus sp. BB11-1]
MRNRMLLMGGIGALLLTAGCGPQEMGEETSSEAPPASDSTSNVQASGVDEFLFCVEESAGEVPVCVTNCLNNAPILSLVPCLAASCSVNITDISVNCLDDLFL